eukprot:c16475_g1_i1.p1 GENE.c16475_g1_i1~~c16475_g1_i1.p1  ORF type:complete len:851 (+),score=201.39 c16475_g1_i1:30-2582(+)
MGKDKLDKGFSLDERDREHFLPGEDAVCDRIPAARRTQNTLQPGHLYITNYALCFRGADTPDGEPFLLRIPVGFICSVEKRGGKRSLGQYAAVVTCKDMRLETFEFERADKHRGDLVKTLHDVICRPLEHMFCATFFAKVKATRKQRKEGAAPPRLSNDQMVTALAAEAHELGWALYDPIQDLKEMGVLEKPPEGAEWRITHANEKFHVCSTYPEILAVSAKIDDKGVAEIAKYRTRGRLPVLVWRNVHTGVALCRSSQPKVGLRMRESEVDKELLQTLSTPTHPLIIADCRPQVNAVANMVKGGGFERGGDMRSIHFLNIDNIHVMRYTLFKLLESIDSFDPTPSDLATPVGPTSANAVKPRPTGIILKLSKQLGRSESGGDSNKSGSWTANVSPEDAARLDAISQGNAELEEDLVEGLEDVSVSHKPPPPPPTSSVSVMSGLVKRGDSSPHVPPIPLFDRSKTKPAPNSARYDRSDSIMSTSSGHASMSQALLSSLNPSAIAPSSSPQSVASGAWLAHIQKCLRGTNTVCSFMEKGHNVLVHCSDGWDRTAQISSLVQLIFDARYRTIEGFCRLVEKDWLAAGHKFRDRCAIGQMSDDQFSPIFLQFIECVWQITDQHPTAFEFNENFLLEVLDGINSNMFGTFLFNCVHDRRKEYVDRCTESLWTWLISQRGGGSFTNKNFRPTNDILRVNHEGVKFWCGFYTRHYPHVARYITQMQTRRPSAMPALKSQKRRDKLIEALEAARSQVEELAQEHKELARNVRKLKAHNAILLELAQANGLDVAPLGLGHESESGDDGEEEEEQRGKEREEEAALWEDEDLEENDEEDEQQQEDDQAEEGQQPVEGIL